MTSRTLRTQLRFLLLLVCCLALTVGCKRPDDGAAEEAKTGDEDPGSGGEPGTEDPSDDEGSPDAPAAEPEDDFDPGPVLSEEVDEDGWSDALAAHWLPDTLAVAVVRPDNLLAAIEGTRARLTDPAAREAFESLLVRIPTEFASLAEARGWAWAGLDPERPAVVWVSAGPSDVLGVFDRLQREMIAGDVDLKARGETIFEALQGLKLHLRVSLPVSDGLLARDALLRMFAHRMRPLSIVGYERAFAAGSTIIALRRDGGRLIIDAVAAQSKDPVVSVAGHLTNLKSPAPNLPRADDDALVWIGFDVAALGHIDAMYGAIQNESGRPEALVRSLTADSPYTSLALALTPERLTFSGRFRDDQAGAVDAFAKVPRLDRSGLGDDVIATLEVVSAIAQPDGIWTAIGFDPPSEELAEWKLDAFVGKSGPIVFALPLWLPMVPGIAWGFVDPAHRYLDPGTGWVAQLALPDDFSLVGPTARLAVAWPEGTQPSAPLGCLLAGEPVSDACPPVNVGIPTGIELGPLALQVALDDRDGTTVLSAASSAEALPGLRAAALDKPDAESATDARVASLRFDAHADLFVSLLGGGAPPPALLDAIGWLELAMDITPQTLVIGLGSSDDRPLLDVFMDAAVGLSLAISPIGGEATARAHLQRLIRGALTSFRRTGADGKAVNDFPHAAEPVCVGAGAVDATDPTTVDWSVAPWSELGFRAHAPFQWKYCYQTSEEHDRFAISAEVDLDGDGTAEQRFCSGGFLVSGEPTMRMLNRGSGTTPCVP